MLAHIDEAVYGIQKKRTFWEVLTSEKYFRWTLLIPLLLTLGIFMLYPMFYCLYYSAHEYIVVQPAHFIGLENFRTVLLDPVFWRALTHTFHILVMCIATELILGMGIALLLNREFRGQNTIRGLCLLPLLVSPMAMSLAWGLLFQFDVGLINQTLDAIGIPKFYWFSPKHGIYTIALITIWNWFPFSVFVLLAGLKGLPRDVFEAARVDGASPWYTFRRLTLPSLMPLVLIIVLLRTMWLIRIFDPIWGTMRTAAEVETLDYLVYRISFIYFDIGLGATMALISLFLTIIVCAILFRQLMLALGAAK